MKFLLVLSMILMGLVGQAQESSHSGPVHWLSFEKAVELNQKVKKPIIIDVFATWCGPCKKMDQITFADSAVASVLNKDFYPVKLDAEQKEDITALGTTFKYVANGRSGYHQLAAALLNNNLQYPTIVFMSEDVKILQAIPGFQMPPDFHRMVQFIGEGHYKTMKWAEWEKAYKSPYRK